MMKQQETSVTNPPSHMVREQSLAKNCMNHFSKHLKMRQMRSDPVALPTQKEGHSWADGEGEGAIKENEDI